MLLPETKEREHRFKLALRIGFPIFALLFALISSTLINTYESLHVTFYFTSILLFTFSIYFIFFLIYKGFDVKITESISKTFTRDYLYTYLNEKLKEDYSLILISIDNLNDINTKYGIKNGDKVLFHVAQYIGKYLEDKNIHNFPIGYIKGGDLIVGLNGVKENFQTMIELLCLKSSEYKVDEIEINISATIIDSVFSDNLDYLIEKLFELKNENENIRFLDNKELIDPNDLELYVINAIKEKSLILMTQDVYENNVLVMKEYFYRIKNFKKKILHPKSYLKIVDRLGLRTQYDFLILENSISHSMSDCKNMFSIVIDPTSLRNNNFLNKAKELLKNNAHVKNKIIFMISEFEYYSYTNKFNLILKSLKKEGVKICIDRVGTLHTSFLYLRELDVDMLRFDSFYTKHIAEENIKSILDGFIVMANMKKVTTWLRMIQTQEEKHIALSMGIDYIQGKLLSDLKGIEK